MTEALAGKRILAIAGAALTGSEAAALAAAEGALVLVLEQQAEPYGAMFERIPVWHFDERDAQIAIINDNLETTNVWFVPRTKLGTDITVDALLALGVQQVLAARGTIELAAPFVQGAVVDDRALLHWFNGKGRRGYTGPELDPKDDAVVVGGGLAAIDCARILAFRRVVAALDARGKQTGPIPLHRQGVLRTVQQHGFSVEALGLGTTRIYVSSYDQLVPAWVDADTRKAIIDRLAEDLVEVVIGAPPPGASMVVTVGGAPRTSPLEARNDFVDLTASLPDLLALERPSPDVQALQSRLLRLRTGLEPLVPPADLDDDTLSDAADALAEDVRLAVRHAVEPQVKAALAGPLAEPEVVARVEAWARQRRELVGAP